MKRLQLELLGRLGLVVSYQTVIRAIKEQSIRAAAQVERRNRHPSIPVVDILVPMKTTHYSLGPIPHDENSNAGNIQILENIFQHQYYLPDSAFEQCLFFIYGDQKTTARIRSIK